MPRTSHDSSAHVISLSDVGVATDMTVLEFCVEAGTYTLSETGTEALRGFYSALVRMLDGGRRLLDVAVFMSLIKEFERSGS